MALCDNIEFVINHIRNSFITSDDTGMCEAVMGNEDPFTLASRESPYGSNDDILTTLERQLSSSLDITSNDLSTMRSRSYTAQRLDRIKEQRQDKTKIKSIHWQQTALVNQEDGVDMFEKKVLIDKPKDQRHSLLTRQLEVTAKAPVNPFNRYSRFDGEINVGATPCKRVLIYLTMCGSPDRYQPSAVFPLCNAKVSDLIGLVLWKYFNEGRRPDLRYDKVENYSLHHVDERGEVEVDMPMLDQKEPIVKFHFPAYALLEMNQPSMDSPRHTVIKVSIPGGEFSKIPVSDADNTTLRDLVDKVLKKRGGKQYGLEYRLQKMDDPDNSLDLNQTIVNTGTTEFCLVRENSQRSDLRPTLEPHDSELEETFKSLQYKAYIVRLHKSLFSTTDVQLAISGEKIEVDPLSSKKRIQPISIDMDSIVECTLMNERPANSVFKLIYLSGGSGGEFKPLEFETDLFNAREIVQQVKSILELKPSTSRRAYEEWRASRKQRKS